VITPEGEDAEVLRLVDAALQGGADVVQVRQKDASDRRALGLAREVVARCREAGATCLVNDRVHVALASGADGVHVGDDDLPVPEVRRLMGGGAVIGATARTPRGARARLEEGASYVGVGPVYATTTKDGLPGPIGPQALAAVVAAVDIPVVAIAGVTAAKVPELLAAGVRGVAVVGAIAAATDPVAATRELVEALTTARADA